MDILYIGDIPAEYHFAVFSDNHIDLYNKENPVVGDIFYRIFLYDNQFSYSSFTVGQFQNVVAKNVIVTDNYIYRRDFPQILNIVFIFSVFFVLIFNIFTSSFKKGGLLGGLL